MIERSTLELTKFGREEIKSTFLIRNRIFTPRIRELSWEEKSFVYLDVGENHKASLLTRKIERSREADSLPRLEGFNLDPSFSFSDIYALTIRTLKDRGFRTVPLVRKIDSFTVATTDLSGDGISSVYDQKIDAIITRDTLPMDSGFVKIPIKELQKEAYRLVDAANKRGVALMSDGPFHIVVRPDGSWYTLLLDIGKIQIYSNPKNLSNAEKHNNQYDVDKTLRAFAKIQENIKALRDARGLS